MEWMGEKEEDLPTARTLELKHESASTAEILRGKNKIPRRYSAFMLSKHPLQRQIKKEIIYKDLTEDQQLICHKYWFTIGLEGTNISREMHSNVTIESL